MQISCFHHRQKSPHLRRFCYSISVSPPLPIPHLPPLFFFCIPPIPAPLSSALFAVTFHAVYLSADSPPHPGTGPQFPRQLYNCFGCVPSATGYRSIIDVKRNMYEARRCRGLHVVPYAASREAVRVVFFLFSLGVLVTPLNRSHLWGKIFHNFRPSVS